MSYPLAHLAPLAVALLVAVIWDIRVRRIPNHVCAFIAVAGIAAQWWTSGALAALAGVAMGAATGGLLFVFWQRGGVGGGDVKLASAVAVWMAPRALPIYWLAAALAGGVVAVVCLLASRAHVRRDIRQNLVLAALQQTMPDVPRPEAGRMSVPYGVAITVGALFVWWRNF